jgi:alkanesulfonate monooxygenase SsuD/methylene tetrahydromethanopterin reductase-like flavin-dependent oxidoreductase (luciferase family)
MAMTLRFGLALMNDFPPDVPPHSRIGEMREQVRAARDAGIGSVWVLNHYLGNMPTLQPLQTLAALAEHAGDMALGTNMFILPLRHPVEVAEEFATLDQISGGRAIAGFGMGYRSNEFESFGIPMSERVARYTESVSLIRELWSGQQVTYEGEFYTVREQRIGLPPARPGGPPIWVGAGVHRAGARRAAELGDAWIVPPHAPLAKVAPLLDFYREERARLGRGDAQEIVVRRELVLDDDPGRAREIGLKARGATTRMYSQFEAPDGTAGYRHLAGSEALAEVADQSYLFTDPESAVRSLRELEAIGVTYVVLRMQWYALEQDRMLQTLETFRDRVLPHFG